VQLGSDGKCIVHSFGKCLGNGHFLPWEMKYIFFYNIPGLNQRKNDFVVVTLLNLIRILKQINNNNNLKSYFFLKF